MILFNAYTAHEPLTDVNQSTNGLLFLKPFHVNDQ